MRVGWFGVSKNGNAGPGKHKTRMARSLAAASFERTALRDEVLVILIVLFMEIVSVLWAEHHRSTWAFEPLLAATGHPLAAIDAAGRRFDVALPILLRQGSFAGGCLPCGLGLGSTAGRFLGSKLTPQALLLLGGVLGGGCRGRFFSSLLSTLDDGERAVRVLNGEP